MVINAVNSSEPDWSSLGMLAEDIKHEQQALPQWSFSFVRRDGNNAARILSRLATKSFLDQMWLHEPPECISDILQMEQFVPSAIKIN